MRKNIEEVPDSRVDYIPDTCAFCTKAPIGLLRIKIKSGIFSDKWINRWVCDDCKHKWITGELFV